MAGTDADARQYPSLLIQLYVETYMLEILQAGCFGGTQETLDASSLFPFLRVVQARSLGIGEARFRLHHLDHHQPHISDILALLLLVRRAASKHALANICCNDRLKTAVFSAFWAYLF